MQDNLAHLEEKLYHEDELCRVATEPREANNGTFRGDPSENRRKLMDDIARALERYRELRSRCHCCLRLGVSIPDLGQRSSSSIILC